MKIVVRRTAGIGDSLAATVVADLLHDQGHKVVWQCHPEVIPIIKRHPTIVRVEPPKGHCDVNLDGCYENHPNARLAHFHDIFITAAAMQLERIGVSIAMNKPPKPPRLGLKGDFGVVSQRFPQSDGPFVGIVPRSNYLTRGLTDAVWDKVIPLINGRTVWISEQPRGRNAIKGMNINYAADLIMCMDLVVTVDTGPMHIASAYGVPMVVISQSHDVHLRLSPLSDFEVVKRRDLDCLNCQRHRCPIDPYNPPCGQIDPQQLADVVNRKLAKLEPSNPIAA